jgi:hypothetical protein
MNGSSDPRWRTMEVVRLFFHTFYQDVFGGARSQKVQVQGGDVLLVHVRLLFTGSG